ncbi:MAG: sigma 54-interacting transcriptional regulator [Desulfobacterales bacterium]|nr:sigma 54-interacting transcriptional regulator [Desulfobacterales bacterium]
MDRILSILNSALVLLEPDMTVVWANQKLRKMFPHENLDGKKCYTVAENRITPCDDCQSLLAFKDGEIHEREFQNKMDKHWHHVIAFPIKDDQGNISHVLEATTDINTRKQAEISRDKAFQDIKALKQKLEEENIYLKAEIREACLFTDIIGSSKALLYVLTRVKQVAETDTSVLICGETGVGKELVARAIHDSSPRSKKPFISVNCAAITSTLIESELFGHERGAFTDAQQRRKGRFELADGGTLFLDEVSELPQVTQAKFLRVLQDGKFERVGGSKTLKSDARIVVATNRDLNKEVSEGNFRSDLFYRLNVFPITVPPLRQRVEDIHLLVDHFVQFFNKKLGKQMEKISESDMAKLLSYPWPGNVRELRNIVERAMITSQGTRLSLQDMPSLFTLHEGDLQQSSQQEDKAFLSLVEVERNHIRSALEVTEWRISGPKGAARMLKINPSTLRSRMEKMGMLKPQS